MCRLATGRCRVSVLVGLLVFVAGHFVVALLFAQSQDTINATTAAQLHSVTERVYNLERAGLPERVRALETTMQELVWVGRGIIVAVIGQLALAVMDRRKNAA